MLKFRPRLLVCYLLLSCGIQAAWLDNPIFYSVYLKSFKDSNGDGKGDLQGLISKLDYLESLGVNAIYLLPITQQGYHLNPFTRKSLKRFARQDRGYESTQLKEIDPEYGSLNDFQELVESAHKRQLKIILDFITIGVDSQHPWLLDVQRNGKKSPYYNYFIIRDEIPSTRWQSYGEGVDSNGWFKLESGGYYYALFWDMPFLNYNNIEVQEYILSVANFWMKKGIDGFRLDAVHYLFFDGQGDFHEPLLMNFIKKIKEVVLSYGDDKILIGEIIPFPKHFDFFGKDREGLDFIWNDLFVDMYSSEQVNLSEFTPNYLNSHLNQSINYKKSILYNSNHDRGRMAAKIISNTAAKDKLLASILFFVPGAPMIYYGDELGITGELGIKQYLSLNAFIAMPWDTSWYGGFTSSNAKYIPLAYDFRRHNVRTEEKDPSSLLNYYKQLISFRKNHPFIAQGDIKSIEVQDPYIYSHFIRSEQHSALVLHNLSAATHTFSMDLSPYLHCSFASVLFATHPIELKLQNDCININAIPPFGSVMISLDNVEWKEPSLPPPEQAIVLKQQTYEAGAESLYSLPSSLNSDTLIKVSSIKEDPQTQVQYLRLDDSSLQITNQFRLPADTVIPFSYNTQYLYFPHPCSFSVEKSTVEDFFQLKSLKEVASSAAHTYLKSLKYTKDPLFWYFEIEAGHPVLARSGGFDFMILFHDPLKKQGADKLSFWVLPPIYLNKKIQSMITYQRDLQGDMINFFDELANSILPGVQKNQGLIFQSIGSKFFIMVDRALLPSPDYDIALIVWSAGGNWSDPAPTKWPITEALPLNHSPNQVRSFIPIH